MAGLLPARLTPTSLAQEAIAPFQPLAIGVDKKPHPKSLPIREGLYSRETSSPSQKEGIKQEFDEPACVVGVGGC